jgi:KUP system potassium uptake protein
MALERAPSTSEEPVPASTGAGATVVAALGVVFGDIGTSPLYAARECFHRVHGVPPTPENVIGVLSLIVWSLIAVVSVKYLLLVLRADNRGEGGIIALMALIPTRGHPGRWAILGILGAALLYGDGIITPTISVLSAVEGLETAAPLLGPMVPPLAAGLLVALFLVQSHGTGRIGAAFGTVMIVWFGALALLGAPWILREPRILEATLPWHAAGFLARHGAHGIVVLGAVFLAVTGADALYADLGHFGRRPIRLGWTAIVLPALLLNYLGQGALLLVDPETAAAPFYRLAPSWALWPLVALATAATVIASQAMISAAFSVTRQLVQLRYVPRMAIRHTSHRHIGQIYVPAINWALLAATLVLVLAFRSSSRLAAAYGVAVSGTMLITTILLHEVMRRRWNWNAALAFGVVAPFLTLDLVFFSSALLKVRAGGWIPLLAAVVVYVVVGTWKQGAELLAEYRRTGGGRLDRLLAELERTPPVRVPGAGVFMSQEVDRAPVVLLHHLKHNKALHERLILLSVVTEDVPKVQAQERVSIEAMGNDVYRVMARYGFMENPDMEDILAACEARGLPLPLMETSFYLGAVTLVVTKRPGMPRWRKRLFAFMARNSRSAPAFFHIPPNRVVELGAHVPL